MSVFSGAEPIIKKPEPKADTQPKEPAKRNTPTGKKESKGK